MLITSSGLTTSDHEIIVQDPPEKGYFYYQVAKHWRRLGIFGYEWKDVVHTET